MSNPEQELHAFIRATFRSVWAIELLCHVRARCDRQLQIDDIVAALRASRLVVERGLADLSAAGLASADEAGHVRYEPASPRTGRTRRGPPKPIMPDRPTRCAA